MPEGPDLKHLPEFVAKMQKADLPEVVIDTFSHYYREVVTGETGMIPEKEIEPVRADEIERFENLQQPYRASGEQAFPNTVRIVLNGGLGTSMGLTGAKSLLEVKNGRSFLEIILNQARRRGVTLALMNSFSTHADSLKALAKIDPNFHPLTFIQHKFPKILQAGLKPAEWPMDPELEWNPPGHGDVYTALYTSGMLEHLLAQGIVYAFVSNSDNLGAATDPALLGYFVENRLPFMMEVAAKTAADVKGGHLARHRNGRFILREAAQCPRSDLEAFRDIERHGFFNTNNVWVNLELLKDFFDKEGMIRLPMILNPKFMDPRDDTSPPVYQIESAMGAAISLFEGAGAVNVPRSRFLPVKKCNDLLAIRSDCYIFSDSGDLMLNPERKRKRRPDTIHINLDPRYYGKIDDFNARFKHGPPSLVDCESLAVEGDVSFERGVTLAGTVVIRNPQDTQAVIENGTVVNGPLTF
jgi:UTP--glucose-1-phosphate uridylyltransferase